MPRRRPLCALALLLTVVAGCATPIRPSGGPVDTVAPRLLTSSPANGDTRVSADRMVLEFSERLDESSAARAVSIAPAFENSPEIRARGRNVEIVFFDSLRPQTTYVISVGAELKDEHGVALSRPITTAFATGDVLDKGRITGTLRDPLSNRGTGGIQLFAYGLPESCAVAEVVCSLPDPREEAPTYSTESTSDGSFRFDYLREGPYFVLALEDLNRNRRADEGERFGVPPRPVSLAIADSLANDSTSALDLFVTARDTTAPQLRRVRSVSNRRLILSFDEAVTLRTLSPVSWTLADSADGRTASIAALYLRPGTPTEVLLLATESLIPGAYAFSASEVVADSSGNRASVAGHITLSAFEDTLSVRFEGFLPSAAPSDSVFLLRPDALPGVRFNQPVDSSSFRQRVTVIGPAGDLPYERQTSDGVSYALLVPSGPRTFRVEVRMPDSTYSRRFAVQGPDALGSISGRIEGHGETAVVVEAHPERGAPFIVHVQPDGQFEVLRLPPGTYRLRVFVDRDGNGRWDGGSLFQYEAAEPIQWLPEPIRVRARWEHEIEAPVVFGNE